MGRTYTDLSHPADRSIDEGLCASLFDGKIPHYVIEKRFLRRDGSVVWGRVGLSLARNTDGSPLYAIAVSEDISERKKHETALKASEEKYRRLVELAEEGIWATDAQGVSTFVNPKMAGMLGYATHEMIGKPLLSFIDENDRETAQAVLERHQSGVTADHDFIFVRRDGSRIYTRVATAPIGDDSGWVGGTLSVIVDITDRRRAEEDIKKSLSEKEILLREIHHRVKNNMQVISSLFNLQAREITDEVMVRVFRKSQSRIKSMALVHEKLYQSNNLAEIDFLDYLNSLLMYLVQQFERRGVTCTVDAEPLFLNADLSIPLGLIVTELVTNALKHAFPGDQRGTIVIGLHHRGENGTLVLTVKDNGIGVPEGIDAGTASTLGLKLVSSLVRQINGTISVRRDNGTMCIVTFHP
jgi:PAS domain S-box-containing protein